MKVFNKVVVVTGGGNGIGRELVLELLRQNARVAAVDINAIALDETAKLAGSMTDRLSTHQVNITDLKAVEILANEVVAKHDHVDGLINNAGIIQPFVRVIDLNWQQIEKVMDINFYGVLYMTKTLLPYLVKRPEAHLVNIASMGGFLPVPGQTVYGASKAAVKLFSEGLHSEFLETNLHVTTVFPGAIGTNISVNSGAMTPEQSASIDRSKMKTTTPQNAARTIIDGMEKNKFRVLVGSDAKMMDFLYRLMPEKAANLIFAQMKTLLK